MAYYTRVLSKDEEFPAFEELALFIRTEHPEYRLTIEEGSQEGVGDAPVDWYGRGRSCAA